MTMRSVLALVVLSLLLGLSPLTAESVIQRGIDVFTTPGDGKTFYDFAEEPIPAGFFCKGSRPFAGRVAFKGLPLTTETPGALGQSDTIVERLDDAVFDARGTAVTRLQFRALSLVSVAPVKTSCGSFHVYVSLAGPQRVTTMNILQTQKAGGNFMAPLAADVKLTFIPVQRSRQKAARKLELTKSFTFPPIPLSWHLREGARAKRTGALVVDTNGDLKPDTRLSGSSNFATGQSADLFGSDKYEEPCPRCSPVVCHEAEGCQHCYYDIPWYCQASDNCM